jgi:outer membrane receptor protein involved in Fe transport
VMYGGSSVKYGNNAGGGVINVITRRPSEKPTVAAYANYADVSHAQDYRLTHSYKIGPVGYAVAGSYQRANAFLWNNDYQAKNIEGKFYVDMPLEGSLTAGVQYTDVERGFTLNNRRSSNPNDPGFFQKITPDFPLSFGESFSPGAGNVTTPGPGADWNKKKVLLDVGYAQPIGRALVELKFYKNWEDRRERNYSASSINSAYSDGALVLDRTVKSDRSYGASGELSMPIGRHDVDAGAEYKVISTGGQDIHSVDTAYGVRGSVTSSAGSSANMWGFYAQDGWSVTDDLLLTPGIRYDIYDGPAEGAATGAGRLKERDLSLSLSGTYRLTRSDTLTASIYRKVVTPSAPDAWWWSEGFGTFYTTDLKAEKNHAVEVTYQHDFWSRASAKLSAYGYRIDDYIKRFSRPEGRGCYNIGKVFLYGVSAAATAKVFSWMSVWGNATYQKSKTAGDPLDPARVSDELEYLPRWKGNLGVDFRLPFGATLGVRERIVGVSRTVYSFSQRGATSYRLIGLASYATTDVELKVPVTKNGEVGVYAENLFDKRYEERFGYALPGLDVGASAKFTY